MFWIALKLFFLGAVAALLIHPYLGLGVICLAVVLATWQLWAFFALPLLWLGTEGLKAWAKVKTPGAQA